MTPRVRGLLGGLITFAVIALVVDPTVGIIFGLLNALAIASLTRRQTARTSGAGKMISREGASRTPGVRRRGPAIDSPNGFQRWLLCDSSFSQRAAVIAGVLAALVSLWTWAKYGSIVEAAVALLLVFLSTFAVARLHMHFRPLAWSEQREVSYFPTRQRRSGAE